MRTPVAACRLIIPGALQAWLPTYLGRYYGMRVDRASVIAGLFVLTTGVGMILCGMLTDRVSRHNAPRKWTMALAYCVGTFVSLVVAFQLSPGPLQLSLIGIGMFLAWGICGPTGAMVANLTPPAIHATAMAVWALANNLLGLATGPLVTGMLADRIGLHAALQLMPFAAVGAALLFMAGKRHYPGDLLRVGALRNEG